MKKPIAAISAGLLGLVVLSGCSAFGGGDEPSQTREEITATTASAGPASPSASATQDPSVFSPEDLPELATLSETIDGAVTMLTLGECGVTAGEQTVSGTITSTLEDTQDFLVVVSWATARGDVQGRASTILEGVEAGEAVDFTLTANVALDVDNCVPTVFYGTK